MVQLFGSGAYLIDGKELIADNADAAVQVAAKTGRTISKEEAAKQTMTLPLLELSRQQEPADLRNFQFRMF